jgi:hypothetical protein
MLFLSITVMRDNPRGNNVIAEFCPGWRLADLLSALLLILGNTPSRCAQIKRARLNFCQ